MSIKQDIGTVEIEMNITGGVKDYAMFTELGNAGVHAIVVAARANKLSWVQVHRALHHLSEFKEFAEATDTMVREMVYDAVGYDNNQEPFYCGA